MLKDRIYLSALLAVCMLLMLVVCIVNIAVDPYGMYALLDIVTFNHAKQESGTHARLYTAGAIRRRAPAVLMLGTSRSGRGISMDHPGWKGTPAERYNASLVGANMYEIERYFEHAHRTRPLTQVVIGLDFFAFNVYRRNQADFNDSLLLEARGSSPWWHELEILKLDLSLDTLYSSWRTVRCNATACTSPFLADGRENPELLELAVRDGGGQHNSFRASAEAGLTRLHFPAPYAAFALAEPNQDHLRHLATIIEIARRDGVDLRFFISPTHAVQCEVLRVAGLWTDFEQWKQQLVALVEQDAKRHPGEPVLPLWDFSGYNSITTEAVPAAKDSSARMQWYWESSHYRKELGDRVLDRVLGYQAPSRTIPTDFGIRLNPENVSEHLANIRRNAVSYRVAHPKQISEIEQLGAEVQRRQQIHHLYAWQRR
jgi:hypothetical protein